MSFFPEIILSALVLLILGFGVFLLFYRKKRLSGRDIEKIRKLWQDITSVADQHPEQAILKADKLLDFALQQAGYRGSLGEKLQKARHVFHDNNAVWSAHKLRNRIAHEVDIQIGKTQVSTALLAFKRAFSDLGIQL